MFFVKIIFYHFKLNFINLQKKNSNFYKFNNLKNTGMNYQLDEIDKKILDF